MSVSVTVPSLSDARSMARPNVYEFRNEKWFADRRWNLISRPLYSRYPVLDSVPTVDVLVGYADSRRRLVEVGLDRRVHGPRSRVRRLKHVVRAELPLHVQVEVMRVRVAEVHEKRRAR